jgi:flagellar secretion chaperone FliS
MNSLSKRFDKAYGADALEVKVLAASPLELVVMLYDGAVAALIQARVALEAGDVPRKTDRLNKAIDILDGLNHALDHQKGGDISGNLTQLYDYMKQRLIIANMKNDFEAIEEVRALLVDLRGAWQELAARPREASGIKQHGHV